MEATQPNIQVYKDIDPDKLYYNYGDGSITFIYIPETKQFFQDHYPATHEDMLENRVIYSAVFGKNKVAASRGQAIKTNALLGRIALDGATVLVAFWKSPGLTRGNVVDAMESIYDEIPSLRNFQESTVLLLQGQNPVSASEYTTKKAESPTTSIDKVLKKDTDFHKKKYQINGVMYSKADLAPLYGAMHHKGPVPPGLPSPASVLCHSDMRKYPELHIPGSCNKERDLNYFRPTHPEMWRRKARELGIPGVYDYGEMLDFRAFFTLQEIFR